jgi:hypothetical protein
MGSVAFDVIPPTDDRTPAEMMGYRVRHTGGTLPGSNMIPSYDVRAIVDPRGGRYLIFYWQDEAPDDQRPLDFQLSVSAVDLAGNVGPATDIDMVVGGPYKTVPDVREMPIPAAAKEVRDAGLVPKFTGSTGSTPGRPWVFSQSPTANTRVRPGSTVTMECRTGPVP